MRYVDAGYAAALASLFVYALSLLARRRRWQRALDMSEPPTTGGEAVPTRGGRS